MPDLLVLTYFLLQSPPVPPGKRTSKINSDFNINLTSNQLTYNIGDPNSSDRQSHSHRLIHQYVKKMNIDCNKQDEDIYMDENEFNKKLELEYNNKLELINNKYDEELKEIHEDVNQSKFLLINYKMTKII